MKIHFKASRILWSCLLGILCFIVPACSKNSSSGSQPSNTPTIAQFVKMGTNTILFQSLITKTGFDTILSQAGPFTAFIAPDASYNAVGINASFITNTPDSVLFRIVSYQIIDGEALSSGSLPAGPNAKLVTSGGDSVFVSSSSFGIFINGVPMVQADIAASNGIIDAMAQPLLPPAGSLLQIFQIDTAFSFMSAAIARASQGSTNVDSILSGLPYTVFVPTNSAFQTAGYATIADINNANPDSLAKIVTYHILAGRFFTSDFVHTVQLPTLNGSDLEVLTGSPPEIKGNNNSGFSSLIQTNIMAQNGVIHTVGAVLLP